MKTFKKVFFPLVALFITSSLTTSCSKDDSASQNLNQNAKVTNYLNSFYAKEYQLGKSVETTANIDPSLANRTTEVENFVITEVFVGQDTRARGYVITDKVTNDFLYFIDVNRVDYKLTSVKIEVNETKVFNEINELEKYLSTDELDYIKIAEDFNAEQSSAERRFWGWGPMFGGDCVGGVRIMYHTYYVFGIGVDTDPVRGLDGSVLQEPCGEAVLGD